MEINEKDYPETFIYYEDKAGICINCGCKKVFTGNGKNTYWKYYGGWVGCKHRWRKLA